MEDEIFNIASQKFIKAMDHYGCPVGKYWPHVSHDFTLRGRSAGQLKFSRNPDKKDMTLRWNLEAATKYKEDFFARTIPHEVAHLIERILQLEGKIRFSSSYHGYQWRRIMEFFEADASVYHNYQDLTPGRKTTKYQIICNCSRIMTCGPKIKNRIQQGGPRTYKCNQCKGILHSGSCTLKEMI
jgi:predicted SprT family Zn-dependent metalloprotease